MHNILHSSAKPDNIRFILRKEMKKCGYKPRFVSLYHSCLSNPPSIPKIPIPIIKSPIIGIIPFHDKSRQEDGPVVKAENEAYHNGCNLLL